MPKHPAPLALLLLVVAWGMLGCGPKQPAAPKTYPVKGNLLDANGEPVASALVEFRSTTNETWKATGVTTQDGTFSLKAFVGNSQIEGTIAGAHRVVVIPPLPQTQAVQANVRPISLAEEYTVNEQGENNFTIQLPPASP